MNEYIRKALLYLGPTETYFRPVEHERTWLIDPGPAGPYPVVYDVFLDTGLFDQFDTCGLPLARDSRSGRYFHLYSRLFAWGLAHWQRYLSTGDECHVNDMLSVCEYVRNTGLQADGSVLLRREVIGKGHVGELSAMDQGLAMSLFCRAWWVTKDDTWLDSARACLGAFVRDVDHDGVVGKIPVLDAVWFEESTTRPLKHILNGMVWALWGLLDLSVTAGETTARRKFDLGIMSLARALPLYDNGYWSLYFIADEFPNYIASMKYHNCHIVQLRILESQTGAGVLGEYSSRFSHYASSPCCRLRAAAVMTGAKIRSYLTDGTVD